MRRNKGFTLVELLAVIVILAIIAVIATPIIMELISDSEEKSKLRSIDGFGRAVEQAVSRVQMNSNYKNGDIVCKNEQNMTSSEITAISAEKNETYCWEKNSIETTNVQVSYSGSKIIGDIIVNKKGGSVTILNAKVENDDSAYYGYSTKNGASDDVNDIVEKGSLPYTSASYFDFYNGTISKSSDYEGDDPEILVIPEEIDGESVTVIDRDGFYRITSTVVVLPSTLDRIGRYAFDNSSIRTVAVTKGNSGITYETYSFSDSDIVSISLPAGSDLSAEGIFEGCTSLRTIYNHTGEKICWLRVLGMYSENTNECARNYPEFTFETGTFNDDGYNFEVK